MSDISYSDLNNNIKTNYMFSNKYLIKLFVPLIIEVFLEYLVGLIDSIMVASVGESAVSAVFLVDFVIAFLISIFAAVATGGAVASGQHIGANNIEKADDSINQLIRFLLLFSVFITLIIYLFKDAIFSALFGSITDEVRNEANIYMLIVAASIPFLAIYNGGASMFRTIGNSKISMKIMISMNILNVIGNALLIYVFKMGIAGAAISTLISRIGSALIIIILGLNKNNLIYIKNKIMYKMDLNTIKRILSVGIPYGIENGMFYLGRLLILSLISTFGTASIAANSVSTLIASLEVLPGMAIGLGLTTIISQCVGANDYNQTKYYTKKIIAIIYVSQTITSAIMLAILPIILNIYHLSAEATGYTYKLSWYHAIMMIIWPLGYSLPVVFRASGDAKFPMIVASVSMVLCRIVLAYVFALYFKMGMVGTWIAMFVDWIVKAIIFTFRYLSGKWIKFKYS
ncbi:MATE family efflux transporter [Brachyspira hyodysenteriae]|uniref:MATE family efflux transporter n=1 Tax=Brachyspira hyodysenteriae TaxID=159 RepID=UPI0022CD806C|nr:MATE family efflux transporter [Brachyspira hyodysenteriae]MCZ9878414.1 MATE family efflux transporter [Brachyspira hyodysenteriae]MCZ9891140.1 MATE family efflux transporter [Brachyspira hyodysenteriae]MCZ9897984.1 MATE family efflux transporter [Brachyspira hyodysenteriae]MCZ9953201.1 MATE family efflux transporter [Brachyspira hyodysenteriae]